MQPCEAPPVFPTTVSQRIDRALYVWRHGLQPQLCTAALTALRDGLARDDSRIIRGKTSQPLPGNAFGKGPDAVVVGACPVAYCGWQAHGVTTAGPLGVWFAVRCAAADRLLGNRGENRWFSNVVDAETIGRAEVFGPLLAEVEAELARRGAA